MGVEHWPFWKADFFGYNIHPLSLPLCVVGVIISQLSISLWSYDLDQKRGIIKSGTQVCSALSFIFVFLIM